MAADPVPVVMGNSGGAAVHLLAAEWLQGGGFRTALCGYRGRAYVTSRMVTCTRCKGKRATPARG